MAKTLLNGVNEVLKRVKIIKEGALLSALTDSARQPAIDLAVQAWNEAVDDLYLKSNVPLPRVMDSGTITLAENQREYTLKSNVVRLYFPFHDETNGDYIGEYEGGIMRMRVEQPQPANFTGQPHFLAIDPENDNRIRLDRIPTSAEAGRVYQYWYDRDVSLSVATDQFPFSNTVFRAMVPVVAQLWERDRRSEFDEDQYRANLGNAARALFRQPPRSSWSPR